MRAGFHLYQAVIGHAAIRVRVGFGVMAPSVVQCARLSMVYFQ